MKTHSPLGALGALETLDVCKSKSKQKSGFSILDPDLTTMTSLAKWEDLDHPDAKLTSVQRRLLQKIEQQHNSANSSNGNSNGEKPGIADSEVDQSKSIGMSSSRHEDKVSEKSRKFETGREFLDWLDNIECNIHNKRCDYYTANLAKMDDVVDRVEKLKRQVSIKSLKIRKLPIRIRF